MGHIAYTEKAFLQLTARRLLRYQREAEARGEVYHDISGFFRFPCGVEAKFRFEPIPSGYLPVVLLKDSILFTPNKLKEIATELLDAPAKLRTVKDDVLEYVRETDAGTSAPG